MNLDEELQALRLTRFSADEHALGGLEQECDVWCVHHLHGRLGLGEEDLFVLSRAETGANELSFQGTSFVRPMRPEVKILSRGSEQTLLRLQVPAALGKAY